MDMSFVLFQGIILSGGKFAEIGHGMDWVTPVITHWVVESILYFIVYIIVLCRRWGGC